MYDPDDKELQDSLKYLQVTKQERLELQSKAFDSKVMCWVPDPTDGYVSAEITGTKGDTTDVKLVDSGQARSVKTELVEQMNPPKFEKCDDMSDLTFLNDPSVLHNLL
ncbi:hypothetical protein GJ496_008402 [Pomphorhynchus laevis]|nr:hypothetical protein GJ496_008402 [Pomphorhynchus laevis]